MATLTLKRKPAGTGTRRRDDDAPRRPVRGHARPRPTLTQAQAEREREREREREERRGRGAPGPRAGGSADRPPGHRDAKPKGQPTGQTKTRSASFDPKAPPKARSKPRPEPGKGAATVRKPRPDAPGAPRGPGPGGASSTARPARPDRPSGARAAAGPAAPRADRREDQQGGRPPARPPARPSARPPGPSTAKAPARSGPAGRPAGQAGRDRAGTRGDQGPRPRDRDRSPDHERARPRGPAPTSPWEHATTAAHPPAAGTLRLSKRMAELGLASRREADEWIERGWVRVDGRVVNQLGSRVHPDQKITLSPQARREQARLATVLLHKPEGYVSAQAEDGHQPAVVLVTADRQWQGDASGLRFDRAHLQGLAPAGRLDLDSEGLLVLTQDGRIARQLIGQDSEMEKEYHVQVRLNGPDAAVPRLALPADALDRLRHGLVLDDHPLRPAQVWWISDDELGFVLTEGRKRQVRRMCEQVGLAVRRLRRVRIGRVHLGDLPPGQWRFLAADESFL